MAATAILEKYGTATAITVTLASLATSTSGVGRQGTLVDNTTNRFRRILLSVTIKLGTSPTGNKAVYVYLIRSDNSTPILDDGAGASDAAHTVLNAPLVLQLNDKSSPATGDVLSGLVVIDTPGPKWTVSINHDTGVNLDSTGGNHIVSYIGINPEIQ